MKLLLIRWRIFILLICLFSCQNSKKNEINPDLDLIYSNPFPLKVGDPFLLQTSDKYYLYGTTHEFPGFKVYSSDNLTIWKEEGTIYDGENDNIWGKDCFWAPEVYERKGKYYMFYSANWKFNPQQEKENFRIGVAVADKPTGPFLDLYNRPIFDPGYPIIDANLYFDDDSNKVYLYYSRCCYKNPVESEIAEWARSQNLYDEVEESWIYGVEIKPDFSDIIGEPKLLLQPPKDISDSQSEWESRSVTSREINRRWTEGSFLFKCNDVYYMMYSANHFGGQNYAVGYATSNSPLGPFLKATNNPVLQKASNGVTGTGHCMILTMPDDGLYCVYHARTEDSGSFRVPFMDRIEIKENKQLEIVGPTFSKQIVISKNENKK